MGKRILVVDDDLMCVRVIQRFLSGEYEVSTALSGIQAVHMVEGTSLDLLLLDIEMPGDNGFSTLNNIRILNNGKQIPVIFITGRMDQSSLKQCAAVGASGYIRKPVEKDILLRQVSSLLEA